MIRYALRCESEGHEFDGWFRSSAEFDRQVAADFLECPVCGSTDVVKALMRPAVAASDRATACETSMTVANPPELAELYRKMQEVARDVRAKADYVGPAFAEEARRIHHGEAKERQIYGEATGTEVRSLLEDGIAAVPLPPLPEDQN